MIPIAPPPSYHPLGYVNIRGRWMHPAPSYPPPKPPEEQIQKLNNIKSRWSRRSSQNHPSPQHKITLPTIKEEPIPPVPDYPPPQHKTTLPTIKEEPIPPVPDYPPPPPSPISRVSDNISVDTDFQIGELCCAFSSNPLDGCEVISLLPFQGKLKNFSHVSDNITFEFDDFMCNCVIKVEKGSVDYVIIIHINPERTDDDPDHHHLKITFHGEHRCYHMQFASKDNSSLYIGTIIDSKRSEWICRIPKEFRSQKYERLLTKLINIYRPAYQIAWGPFMIDYNVDKHLVI